jgi:hypothetical protein
MRIDYAGGTGAIDGVVECVIDYCVDRCSNPAIELCRVR